MSDPLERANELRRIAELTIAGAEGGSTWIPYEDSWRELAEGVLKLDDALRALVEELAIVRAAKDADCAALERDLAEARAALRTIAAEDEDVDRHGGGTGYDAWKEAQRIARAALSGDTPKAETRPMTFEETVEYIRSGKRASNLRLPGPEIWRRATDTLIEEGVLDEAYRVASPKTETASPREDTLRDALQRIDRYTNYAAPQDGYAAVKKIARDALALLVAEPDAEVPPPATCPHCDVRLKFDGGRMTCPKGHGSFSERVILPAGEGGSAC
jgi:hypothetical protein